MGKIIRNGIIYGGSGGSNINVDSELSTESENPVQNKIIKTALDKKADLIDGKVPSTQLPSYVDDIIEGYYNDTDGKFYEVDTYETEIAGERGKIYLSLDTDKNYRWTGTLFLEINKGGHTIVDGADTDMPDRTSLKFTDSMEVTDDSTNDQTEVDIHKISNSEWEEIMATQPSFSAKVPPVGFTPVGTVISVMGNSAPQHYLACNGQIVYIKDYPELAAYFENQFGSKNYFGGDGTSTFGIPDLRGEFLRGTGTNSHANSGNGSNVGIHQDGTAQLYCFMDNTTNTLTLRKNSGLDASMHNMDKTFNWDTTKTLKNVKYSTNNETSTGENFSVFTTRPTNTSVLYCIATKNIYIDARNDYSTVEKVVGTWIDGKPLYQKTYTVTVPIVEAKTQLFVTVDNDLTKVMVEYSGQALDTNGEIWTLPFTNISASSGLVNTMIHLRSDSTNGWRLLTRTYSGMVAYTAQVTVKYTKTTD